jgi:hypothetical protein
VVAELLAVGALCVKVELKTTFDPECFGEGAKAGLGGKVLGSGASGDDGDGGGCFPSSFVVSGEPSWLFGECQASVVGCEFLSDVGQGGRGGDAMH